MGESITRLHTGASRRRRLLFHLLEIRETEHSALLFTRRRACIKKKEMKQIAWRTSHNDTPDDENGGALNVNTHTNREIITRRALTKHSYINFNESLSIYPVFRHRHIKHIKDDSVTSFFVSAALKISTQI